MSDLRQFLDLHHYGQAWDAPPLWAILFVAYALLLVAMVLAWGRKPKPSAEERAADDAEEMAWVRAHAVAQNARLRRDRRAQHVADEALQIALHGKLRRELGQ